jgi:diacylglycerol kinase (ATP)
MAQFCPNLAYMTEATLLHNPKAGDEEHSKKKLLDLLEKNGYDCRYSSTKKDGWNEFDTDVDLLIVAGGDGTIRKTVTALAERNLLEKAPPIAVLPLGTANNISKALDISGSDEEIIEGWKKKKPRKFDVGIIDGADSVNMFLEAFGFGLFPSFMNKVEQDKIDKQETVEEEVSAVLQAFHEFIFGYQPRKCTIEIDGKDATGEYLMAEVMNINHIGTNFQFAPKANSSDGKFEVVLLEEKHRAELSDYILMKIKGKEGKNSFPSVRAETIRITWDGTKAHADDTRLVLTPFAEIKISIKPGLLQFIA